MRIQITKNSGNSSHTRGWMILIMIFAVIIILSGLTTGGVVWHRQPGFCTLCHTPMKSYVENYFAGDKTLLITQHASGDTTNLKCVDCHSQKLSQQLREGTHWLTGNYTFPLEKRKFGTRSTCLTAGCHVEADIIEATKEHDKSLFSYNPHDPRHGKQQCYNCHSMHGESVFSCNQCHNFELPDGWIAPQPNGVIVRIVQ